jgi:acyl transferase domain-containing protein
VGLIEAHGTGTVVGDRTELSTLTSVFTAAGMGRAECVAGSVKSNIGHTKCTAGLAGLVKAAKAVYHGVQPPTLNITRPNQAWDPEASPFVFLDAARPWVDDRRVAGVSAFGFGGTNFHAVIEAHADDDLPDRGVEVWPAELVALRGDDTAVERALADLAARMADPAPAGHPWRLRDLAAAVSTAGRGPVRLAIVADDLDDLRAKVEAARAGRRGPGIYAPGEPLAAEGEAPTVAFLFPGQGSQRPGMASDLFVSFAETRPLLRLGKKWAATMLPPAAFSDAGRDEQRRALTDTRVAQPALGIAGLAATTVLDRFGVRPDIVAGHSYGELVALCVAGALDPDILLALSEARGEAMVAAVPDGDPGGMVAVAAARERIYEVLHDVDVVVANDNHPTQIVVAGTTPAVEEALGRLEDAGITAKRLPVACAFHSPVVAAAADTLARHLDAVEVSEPLIPVFSNLTADAYPADGRKARELLAAQVANGVRFTDEIRAMYEAGARVFVEVGPGRTLTGCVERTLEDRPHLAVATDRPGDDGVRAMLHALARLAVAGVAVDVGELFEGRGVDPTRWTQPPPAARWTVNGHLVRLAGGDTVPGALRPATTTPPIPAGGWSGNGGDPAPAVAAPATAGGTPLPATFANVNGNGHGAMPADQVLAEYFRTAHGIMAAGHQLVLNYLGVTPTAAPAAPPAPVAFAPAPPVALPPPPAPAVAPAPVPPVAPARALPSGDELLVRLTAIVSARTGYPEDMLGPDLDVEADLSIDSIKRLEILGELADQIGLADDGSLDQLEDLVEELAGRKTLRGVVDFLVEHADQLTAGTGPAVPAPAPAAAETPAASSRLTPPAAPGAVGGAAGVAGDIPPVANRFTVVLTDEPLAAATDSAGLAVHVTGAGTVAARLVDELVARGVVAGAPGAAGNGSPSLVVVTDLLAADGEGGAVVTVSELYARLRPLLLDTAADLLVVTPLGGGLGIDPPAPVPEGDVVPVGAGVRGLVKTAALEFPDRQVRLVDVDPGADPATLARQLADEVAQAEAPVEVAWLDGVRRSPEAMLRPTAAGPAASPLAPGAVVLVTGGARGITAEVAVALARSSGCRLELVGRSALPETDEDPALAAAGDRGGLRRALIASGMREPRAIEAECHRLLAEREVRATMSALAEAGAAVRYHRVDVTDSAALAAVVRSVYESHGRLDGVVHGAGVLDDHVIADKSPESFARVYDVKVEAARTLLAALAEAAGEGRTPPALLAFFGSIAGVCGNRGQVDYAAANDALDTMAAAHAGAAGRVVALDWGPWAPGAGMVSPELARLFEHSGMGLIEVPDGTAAALDEIAAVGPAHQVVVARCSHALMSASLGHDRRRSALAGGVPGGA